MQNDTAPRGEDAEPALIYNASERRTHVQHATESYVAAGNADGLLNLADAVPPERMSFAELDDWRTVTAGYRRAAFVCRERAQWHATMAVYEALAGSSITPRR